MACVELPGRATDLRTDDFDYELPPELIAQKPAAVRDASRLLVLDRSSGEIRHHQFSDLASLLSPGDLLVANRSRVIPARLRGRKETGGRVELLLLRPLGPDRWTALARPSRRLHPGIRLSFNSGSLTGCLREARGDGEWLVEFESESDTASAIRAAGTVPLPPYIRNSAADPARYQTVYADRDGSVAAPTAGLHFSHGLLASVHARGIGIAYVTLHVGLGTFRPVTAEHVADHQMHPEWGELPPEVADAINHTRERGGRVVAVGTTTTRLLESAAGDDGVRPFCGDTSRFIYPTYHFRAIDALVTNFHLPRSTLLMLVSAFAGRDLILRAYREAIDRRYRFFSFGDAMLIL